jgi:hypothetical protein
MSIVLLGSTSGSCTLQEQAVAGTTTLTLPTFNGTVGLLVSGTAVASTSGTSIDFTGLPAGVRRITVMLNGVSLSGTSNILVQLGDSGGVETTGYVASISNVDGPASCNVFTSTAGFIGYLATGGRSLSGNFIINLLDSATNTWSATAGLYSTAPSAQSGGGAKALSATLDRVRITTVNGTDTFDAGAINILYE